MCDLHEIRLVPSDSASGKSSEQMNVPINKHTWAAGLEKEKRKRKWEKRKNIGGSPRGFVCRHQCQNDYSTTELGTNLSPGSLLFSKLSIHTVKLTSYY